MRLSNNEFTKLAGYIKLNFGINLPLEKKILVTSRLSNIVERENFSSFAQYYDYVTTDTTGKSIIELADRITTNHTFFYREKKHFDYLKNMVLPYLASVAIEKKDLRIWSAGCSSGDEPYTIAMIIADYFGDEKNLWNTKILATDICTEALKKAVQGIYSNEQIALVPKIWKLCYFKKTDNDNNAIVDKIKKDVIFRRLNLMSSFSFKKKFHLIFCRNVMIYFDIETKKKLLNKFYDIMEPGGYLFVGHSEGFDRNTTKFKYIMPSIYRKE